MQWYYAQNGNVLGPIEEAALFELAKAGKLLPDDLVWNETMGQEWAKASTVSGLFAHLPPALTPVAPPRAAAAGVVPPPYPSCTAPVSVAWQSMKLMLFAPFDMGRWFVLGFSAWLATLGESGGFGFNPMGLISSDWSKATGQKTGEKPTAAAMADALAQAKTYLHAHAAIIMAVGAVAIAAGIILGLLLLWLRCRGKFMFLDNVVNNRADIGVPWHEFTQHGHSLFWWSLVYGIVCLVIFVAIAALAVFAIVVPCIKARAFWLPSVLPSVLAVGLLLIVLGLVATYIARFLEDFIIPMMYRFDLTATEAWARFLPLLKRNFGRLLLYGLFYLALEMLAGLCILGVIVITCCVAGCLMGIPYLGAVVLLPVSVFFRLYSIEYLAQFGPEYRLEPEQS